MGKVSPKTAMNRRIKELKAIFAGVDEDKMKLVMPSIQQAAKMEQYIESLSAQLDAAGFVEEYQNGENQYGKKESTESKAYSTMVKNYNAVVRTLLSCLPENVQPPKSMTTSAGTLSSKTAVSLPVKRFPVK